MKRIKYVTTNSVTPDIERGEYYALTKSEARILAWIRRNTTNGRHWMGTIRYVKGGPVQLFDATPAGRIDTG